MEYLQSKRNSTSEQKDKGDAMKPGTELAVERVWLPCPRSPTEAPAKIYNDTSEKDDDNEQETLLSYLKLDTAEPQYHRDQALLLMTIASLGASVTNWEEGFCEENKAYHRLRCTVFFLFKATSFGSSLAILLMLLVNRKLSARGIQPNALSACVILDMIGLTGAVAAVSSKKAFVHVFILVFAVVLGYIMLQVVLGRVGSGSLAETCFLGHKGARGDDDANNPREQEQFTINTFLCQDTAESQHHRDPALSGLLLLACVGVSLTYQAGLSTPGGLWEEEYKAYHQHRRKAFRFYNAIAFGSSLAIIMLLLNRKRFARGVQSHALSACVILLTGAFAAVSSWNVSTSVYVFVLVFAVLGCIALQVLVRVGSVFLAKTCLIVHKGARSKRLLMILRILDHLGNATTGRCKWTIKRSRHEATWRLASGAMHHMTGNQSLLLAGDYLTVHDGEGDVPLQVYQQVDGGEVVPLRARGSGSVRTERIALDDVWYVPGLDSSLVSTGQLARQGCDVTLGPGGCRITRAGALVGSARFTEACHFQLDFLKVAGSE